MYNDFICFPQIQTVMVEFAFKWLYIFDFLSFPSPTPVHQSLRAPKRLVFPLVTTNGYSNPVLSYISFTAFQKELVS